jgi:hypothetical protein
VNRVESITPPESQRPNLEPTAKLLRRLLVGYVPIKIEGVVNAEGDVAFRVGFQDMKTTLADYMKIPYRRSRLLSNVMAEILIRQHLDEFSTLLTRIPGNGYHHAVKRYNGRVCGLWVEPTGIKLQFHVSWLYEALNEHLLQIVQCCPE